MVGNALEGLGEPSCRVDVIHPAGLEECGDGRPCAAAAVRSGEETVFSGDRLGPDGPLDDVGIDLDQAVGQEPLEDVAPGDGIAQGFGQL